MEGDFVDEVVFVKDGSFEDAKPRGLNNRRTNLFCCKL